MLEQLNILEGFDLSALGPISAERIHLMVEAKKLAFADRNGCAGDPAYVRWPLAELIGKAHAERRRAELDPRRAGTPVKSLVGEHAGDTSYFAIVDTAGNAISFVHSLSWPFGSGRRRWRDGHHAEQPGRPRLQPRGRSPERHRAR